MKYTMLTGIVMTANFASLMASPAASPNPRNLFAPGKGALDELVAYCQNRKSAE